MKVTYYLSVTRNSVIYFWPLTADGTGQEGNESHAHIRVWNPMPGLPGPTYETVPDIMSTSGRGIYLCVRVEGFAPPRY